MLLSVARSTSISGISGRAVVSGKASDTGMLWEVVASGTFAVVDTASGKSVASVAASEISELTAVISETAVSASAVSVYVCSSVDSAGSDSDFAELSFLEAATVASGKAVSPRRFAQAETATSTVAADNRASIMLNVCFIFSHLQVSCLPTRTDRKRRSARRRLSSLPAYRRELISECRTAHRKPRELTHRTSRRGNSCIFA